MKKIITYIGATLAFWALVFLGPALVMLMNNVGYYVSGGGWGPDSFMYKVLQFFSQPIACAMAYYAIDTICKGKHLVCVLVNCVVAACLSMLLGLCEFIIGKPLNAAQMILSGIVCIAYTVSIINSWNDPNGKGSHISNTKKSHGKSHKILGYVGITVLLWLFTRIIPGIVGAMAPNSILLRAAAMLCMLPAGWAAAKALSKGAFSGCIRANLYVFAALEGFGALEALIYVIQNLSLSTGRYSYDMNGIAYAEYVTYFGGLLLYEVIYVVFCVWLAKNVAPETSPD